MYATELYAHTPVSAEESWQLLKDHLVNVARIAAGFAEAFGAKDMGEYLGLLHDLGKASCEFQEYLHRCHGAKLSGKSPPRPSTDHKLVGAYHASSQDGYELLLGIPIFGHHGGMPSLTDLRSRLNNPEDVRRVEAVLERALPIVCERLPRVNFSPTLVSDPLACELFLRMLFSCLVDADYLDTERHWYPKRSAARSTGDPIGVLWERFQSSQSDLLDSAEDTRVNRLRREIYEACISAAEKPQGVFRLTVPTGGGKTRSGMGFALRHAHLHNLDRVVVAIPYTSIIDQNAQVYRQILGESNVLEHHSAVNLPDDEDYSEERLRMDLGAENWDMPVVVTTTVQLFESLFSNKPSKCRKLHNLARSVIILDEVQTLPTGLVQPILDILKHLVEHFGVTLVLSTATQPAFQGQSPYLSGFSNMVDIVDDPGRYFNALTRVEYRVEPEAWSWEKVAGEMKKETCKQVLCVVNSRKDAIDLFKLLDDPEALHLSTLMCQAHRRDVLDEIRRRLASGEPCRVISTQVVEAGVDLDFPCVMRALGPLDRIVQAAGRCNREGKMDGLGEVIVFRPEDGRAPKGAYAIEMTVAATHIAENESSLAEPKVIEHYFAEVYQMARRKGLDRKGIRPLREDGEFPEVARRAKLIEQNTVTLVVKYRRREVETLLYSAKQKGFLSRDEIRWLQQCTVDVYERDYLRYLTQEHLVEEVVAGINVWRGEYDDKTGISEEMLDPCDLIVG